jgi:hypothetical protein
MFRAALAKEKGAAALEPHNMSQALAGARVCREGEQKE